MGMAKRPHIAALLRLPRIAASLARQAWARANRSRHRCTSMRCSCRRMSSVAARYADVIPGRRRGCRRLCGAAASRSARRTGYTREIMAEIIPVAAAQGFAPDSHRLHRRHAGRPTRRRSCSTRRFSSSPSGRPGAASKSTTPRSALPEGLNGGAGPSASPSPATCSGCRSPTRRRLPPNAFAERRAAAGERLAAAGAHYVIDGVADLMPGDRCDRGPAGARRTAVNRAGQCSGSRAKATSTCRRCGRPWRAPPRRRDPRRCSTRTSAGSCTSRCRRPAST